MRFKWKSVVRDNVFNLAIEVHFVLIFGEGSIKQDSYSKLAKCAAGEEI